MIKSLRSTLILTLLFTGPGAFSQVFWSENFNNGCTTNCNVSGYSGANGAWSVSNTGPNGNIPNAFFVSCAENGEPVGSCGAGCGNDATLHVGSVPCGLCLFCPNGDCGASYNAGPTFGGEDPQTNIRAETPSISTLGKSSIDLTFKYMERGQGISDDATVEYSINNGSSWLLLTNPSKTATTCGGSQGLWTSFTYTLPPDCDNISSLKLGFRWVNNSDGVGSDPSFAVDEIELSSAAAAPPVAGFGTAVTAFCDSTCISFTDSSANAPTSWTWILPGATPPVFTGQNPSSICYNVPGIYDVTLIAGNAAGTDTLVMPGYITVNPCFIPQAAFSSSDTTFCEKNCVDFTDLSTNNPATWQWYFPGASPETSTNQNPQGICYNTYGSYTVKLVVTNATGTDSVEFTGFITVNQLPASPVASLSGTDVLTSTPSASYQWYYNSALIPGAVNQVHIAQATGSYYVSITDSNGCQAVSNNVYVGFTGTGMGPFDSTPLIYPNPARDAVHFEMLTSRGCQVVVDIYDVSGRIVISGDLIMVPGKVQYSLNISKLDRGTYFIKLNYCGSQLIKKLLKE